MATLNVTISEEVNLYGSLINKKNTYTIPDVTKTKTEIKDVTIAAIGYDTIVTFNASGTGVSFEDDPKYIRITNLGTPSSDEDVYLMLMKDQQAMSVKIGKGESFYMFNNDMYAETWGATGSWSGSITLDNITEIRAGAGSGGGPVEIFMAI